MHPPAVVVIGGLISSTLLDQVVTPALFHKLGRAEYAGRMAATLAATGRSRRPPSRPGAAL